MVLSDDVKAQDRVNALTFLYMGNRENTKIALQFLKEHVNEIRNGYVCIGILLCGNYPRERK